MANIRDEIAQIQNALYGKDVREALASGIEAINTETEDTTSRQNIVEQNFTDIKNSETTRVSNETARQQSEVLRENAETQRISAESSRQNNEEIRQANELNREAIINAAKVCEPYNEKHTYYMYNKAVDGGSTYECINPVIAGIKGLKPSTDAGSNWLCIALKGSDGIGGDMFKSTYDSNNSGVVDNAEKLGGQLPSYYAKQSDFESHKADYTLQIPFGGTTTNSGNDYSIATPAIASLVAGMAIAVKINADSTGATTLNWNGKGAKSIKKANGNSITNLKNGGIYTFRYDGINFILQGEGGEYGTATADKVLTGYSIGTEENGVINGTMANNGSPTYIPSNADQTITAGYYAGGKVSAVVIDGSKVLTGTTLYGTAGTAIDGSKTMAGDFYIANIANGSYSNYYYTYSNSTEITLINGGGILRVRFQLNTNSNEHIAYGRIYVNNIPIGIERKTTSMQTSITFTEDINVNANDKIAIFIKNDGIGTTTINNFGLGVNLANGMSWTQTR